MNVIAHRNPIPDDQLFGRATDRERTGVGIAHRIRNHINTPLGNEGRLTVCFLTFVNTAGAANHKLHYNSACKEQGRNDEGN
jgi:hypothetical protein